MTTRKGKIGKSSKNQDVEARMEEFERAYHRFLKMTSNGSESQMNLPSCGGTDGNRRINNSKSPPTKTPQRSRGNSTVLPNAPVKQRKPLNKVDLKPKQLMFSRTNAAEIVSIDSGFDSISENNRHPTKTREQGQKSFKVKDKCKNNQRGNGNKFNDANKENDLRMGSSSYKTRSSKPPKKLFALENHVSDEETDSDESVMSQCVKTSWEETLRWLQPRRDVGLYIQCTRKQCGKWRYTDDYHDPVDVPKIWVCEMNSDATFGSCSLPQEEIRSPIKEDLIENKYNAGSIVWARVNGYPWWPAMVDDCPELFRYYELRGNSNVPFKYHVTFFVANNEKVERGWILNKDLKPYIVNPRNTVVKKTVFKKIDYAKRLDKACEVAESAVKFSIYNRLKRFSFVERTTPNENEAVPSKTTSKRRKNQGTSRRNNKNSTEPSTIEQMIPSNLYTPEDTSNSSYQSGFIHSNITDPDIMWDSGDDAMEYNKNRMTVHTPTLPQGRGARPKLIECRTRSDVDDIRLSFDWNRDSNGIPYSDSIPTQRKTWRDRMGYEFPKSHT